MFKNFFQKLIDGFIYGLGFFLFSSIIVLSIAFGSGQVSLYQIKTKLQNEGLLSTPPEQIAEAPTTVLKEFTADRISVPPSYDKIYVESATQLREEINKFNKRDTSTGTALVLAEGVYELGGTTYIGNDRLFILSENGNPYKTIIRWKPGGLYNKGGNLFRVSADHFYIDGITLEEAKNHLIQVAGEANASFLRVNNCILQDSYEQFIKVSYSKKEPRNKSIEGVVSNSIFQFTQGIAKNYYTGGIDAIGAVDWLVASNIFRDIASPKSHIAQHAVHFWVNASGTRVINNLFIDNDRSIGLGMPLSHNEAVLEYSHKGGEVKGNVIFHSDNGDPFGDTGIIVEAAEDALIEDNYIFMQHGYPRAIEYRYDDTKNIIINKNLTNKKISSRNSGNASLKNNQESLSQQEFLGKYAQIQDLLGVKQLYYAIEK